MTKFNLFSSTKLKSVGIENCVHYCGFIYGRNQYNPYEDFVRRIHLGKNTDIIQSKFMDFFRFYRPKFLGEALGVTLSKNYPLWIYPWQKKYPKSNSSNYGWHEKPDEVLDIMTQFCKSGIPTDLLIKEFGWLQAAYQSIKAKGYTPKAYGYAYGKLLLKNNLDYRVLLIDGNHRTSALSVLGEKEIELLYKKKEIVRERDCSKWPGVKQGRFKEEDALKIFNAYFSGNENYRTTQIPAEYV